MMTRPSPTGSAIPVRGSVPVPASFLSETVAEISSMAELQVSLAMFRIVAHRDGDETPVAERTIMRDEVLRKTLRRDGIASDPEDRIFQGLELAVGRGTLLRFRAQSGAQANYWYYLNTSVNRATIAAMERGALPVPSIIWEGKSAPSISIDPPNAFQLYEQNIGPLTPMIADQISQAIEEFPADWIEDAIGEAVNYNRRSWRYVLRILETWKAMGRREQDNRAY